MKTKSVTIMLLIMTLLFPRVSGQDEQENWSCTPFEVKKVDAQQALVMKADVPMMEISSKIGEMYKSLYTYIMENDIQVAGPSFAIYHSWEPGGNIVFEAGVPVAGEAEGTNDISFQKFPKMKVLSTLYKGSYADMEPTYNKLTQYMEENELEPEGNSWEVYLTDPTQVKDPSMNQTLIYFPLK